MIRFMLRLVVFGMLVNCTETQKEPDVFLKVNQLQLSPPILKTSSTIIDTSITLNADFKMEGASIHYIKGVSNPSLQDIEYTKPLKITEVGIYNFRAFHKDWKVSKTASVKVYKKGVSPQNIEWKTKANKKYSSLDNQSLINHQKASLSFTDAQWTGFDTTAIATVIFNEKKHLKKLTIGYLVDTKSWIFPPEKVAVFFNKNDSLIIEIPKIEKETNTLSDIEIPINRTVNTIEIRVDNNKYLPDWHPGKGLKAWLFMDEWIFN